MRGGLRKGPKDVWAAETSIKALAMSGGGFGRSAGDGAVTIQKSKKKKKKKNN
jgi:hypothetical protein